MRAARAGASRAIRAGRRRGPQRGGGAAGLSSAAGGDAVVQIAASLTAQLNLAAATNASGAGAEGLKTRDILVSALTDADAESLSAEAVGRTSQVTRSACVMPFCEVI